MLKTGNGICDFTLDTGSEVSLTVLSNGDVLILLALTDPSIPFTAHLPNLSAMYSFSTVGLYSCFLDDTRPTLFGQALFWSLSSRRRLQMYSYGAYSNLAIKVL